MDKGHWQATVHSVAESETTEVPEHIHSRNIYIYIYIYIHIYTHIYIYIHSCMLVSDEHLLST